MRSKNPKTLLLLMLTASLLFSGVANAAMLCCAAMSDAQSQTEQGMQADEAKSDMPCHSANSTDDADQDTTNIVDCECVDCVQMSAIIAPLVEVQSGSIFTYIVQSIERLKKLALAGLFDPPKHFS